MQIFVWNFLFFVSKIWGWKAYVHFLESKEKEVLFILFILGYLYCFCCMLLTKNRIFKYH